MTTARIETSGHIGLYHIKPSADAKFLYLNSMNGWRSLFDKILRTIIKVEVLILSPELKAVR
jgi:hypothetical protein